jgi:DNA-binding transcriptional LysR family regulator
MQRHFDPMTLRLFIAVCEERNIARAAEREAIVPSAISKRVAQIEEQLRVPLLKRSRRGIEPTPAGEVLLRHARDELSTMERMHAELSEFAGGAQGSVRVFASPSVLAEALPDDIAAFLGKHRKMRVALEERNTPEIVRGVREGAVDFGVCWDAGELSGLETVPYRVDHLCIVCRPTHPLASRKRLAFADTLGYEQIQIRPGSLAQHTLRRAAALANETLHQRIQVSTFDAACRNVAAGLGIAVLPREAVQVTASGNKLRLVPLTDAWAERRFVICMRSRDTLTAAARLLADFLHTRSSGQKDGR